MSRQDLIAIAKETMKFTEVFQDKIQMGYPDGFPIDSDMDEVPVGYYTSSYDYPICNHTDEVTDDNLGYVKGITAGGVPFEAELFEKDENMTMAVILPAIFTDAYEGEDDGELSDENTSITAMHYEMESVDCSVLDIGMVDDAMEENMDVVKDYVYFLENNGIVTFASDLRNGAVLYRIDLLGNNLAKVLITLREGEEFVAYTDLDFYEFPKKHKNYVNHKLKVVRTEEK